MKLQLICFVVTILEGTVLGQTVRNQVINTNASCDQSYIYFRLNFQRLFQGVIYSEEAYSSPSCLYVNGSVNPRLSYDIRIPLTKCRTRRLPTGLYENSVIVQQDTRLLESTDQKFLLTCGPGESNQQENRFTVSFGGLTVQGTLGSTQLVTGKGGDGPGSVNYEVEVQSGPGPSSPTVQSAVAVGESISYVIRIPNLVNSDARIGYCWANDGISEIQLSDQRGCTSQTTGDVWGTFQSRSLSNGKVMWNNIRAWAFPTSNRVNIFCNLHLCSGVCPQVSCDTVRIRRDKPSDIITAAEFKDHFQKHDALIKDNAHNLNEDIIEVAGSFEVIPSLKTTNTLDSYQQQQRQRDVGVVTGAYPFYSEKKAENKDKVCIDQVHFGVGVALLMTVVFASFLIVLAIGCRNFHRSRKRKPAVSGFERDSQFEWNQSNLNVSTLSSSD